MTDSKIYTIPLKHSKVDVVLVGEELNELLWGKGITNPPAKVKVEVTKQNITKDNKTHSEAFVNLVGIKKKVVEQKKKGILSKDENSGLKGKLKSAVEGLKQSSDKKTEEVQEPAKDVKKEKTEEKVEVTKDEKKETVKASPVKAKTEEKVEVTKDEKKETVKASPVKAKK